MDDQGRTGIFGATLDAVLFLFALIGMVAVAAAVWVAVRPQPTVAKQRPRVLPPDDDPDFLRQLNERRNKRRDDGLTG
jgi:hypothetical protein